MAGASAGHVDGSTPEADARPLSIMIPMLNEAAHVADLVADIASQDYEGELEVLVADGGSTDGSPELLLKPRDRRESRSRCSRTPGVSCRPGSTRASGVRQAI